MAKEQTKYSYSEKETKELEGIAVKHGYGHHAAQEAKKILKYPEYPKRTIGAIKNKLRKIYMSPRVLVSEPTKASVPKVERTLAFVGEIKGDMLELTITTNISNLRSLM